MPAVQLVSEGRTKSCWSEGPVDDFQGRGPHDFVRVALASKALESGIEDFLSLEKRELMALLRLALVGSYITVWSHKVCSTAQYVAVPWLRVRFLCLGVERMWM